MATKLSGLVCLILITIIPTSSGYGTCDDGDLYHIEKYTLASTDSERDYNNGYKLFPFIRDQDTSHFNAGLCANGMKLELPDSCFKLHSPQTWQHDEGLLSVDILEHKMSNKWKSVLSDTTSSFNYDSFFDFSLAFWVKSLDDYINQWIRISDDHESDVDFEYFGIEWVYNINDIDLKASINDDNYINNKFYSILVHLPASQHNYEFISYLKPSSHLYDKVKWIKSNMVRTTFKQQQPWNRDDNAVIIPMRISIAASDFGAMYDFYVNIMESDVLYANYDTVDDLNGDNIATKYAFFSPPDTKIEIQIVERESYYTFGSFLLTKYEDLLMETHDSIITSPFCGIDRWMDNHYGFTRWSVPGYLDRILIKLKTNGVKYRIYQTLYEHSSASGKIYLDKYNKDRVYIFWIFQPNGQSVQFMGDFENTIFSMVVPNWMTQWCWKPCPNNMIEGTVDSSHIYNDDHFDDNNKILALFDEDDIGEKHHQKYLLATLTAMICGIGMCSMYYCYKKWRDKRAVQHSIGQVDDITPLIHKK